MKKALASVLIIGLLAVTVYCAASGYRDYRLFVLSHGTSEQTIRLDIPGTFSVMVDPPGRSLFRGGKCQCR